MKISIKQIDKMLSCVPEDVYWRSQDALWNDEKYVEVSEQEYRTIMERYKKKLQDDRRLSKCVELNNKGIELEKNGEVDAAIEVYEKNIKPGCWQAMHAFDRLLVIYRRRKDYLNEKRVCTRAIEEFPKEDKYIQRIFKIEKLIEKHGTYSKGEASDIHQCKTHGTGGVCREMRPVKGICEQP